MNNKFILTPYFLDQHLPKLQNITEPDWVLNTQPLPAGDQQLRMTALHEPIAKHVAESLRAGNRPVSIAGDCCATIAVAAGLQRAAIDYALFWFDAHGDFNTWETTPSDFLGGMPLAMLVGRGDQKMTRALGLQSLREDRVLLTDARDLDPEEKIALRESKVTHVPNVSGLLDDPITDLPIYIHFDVDILDPLEAPAMSYPAHGGPSVSELEQVFHLLERTREIVAVSVSTWNPDLEGSAQTQMVSKRLLDALGL